MTRGWAEARGSGGFWRLPLVHFLLLGVSLFAAERCWARFRPSVDHTIVVAPEQVGRLRRSWHARTGVEPNAVEERALVEQAADEEMLVREALALGLDRNDGLVRDRLVKLAGFLGLTPDTDVAARERAARALGLERTDPVIRRYLAELMDLGLGGAPTRPDERAVGAELERRGAELGAPARSRLSHVYFSRDRHGDSLDADARHALERLRADGTAAEGISALGDAFPEGAQLGARSHAELARAFGESFASAIDGAPIGAWCGPVRSAHGLHLVWVHAREAAKPALLGAVRSRLELDIARRQQADRREERLRSLRAMYRIEVGWTTP